MYSSRSATLTHSLSSSSPRHYASRALSNHLPPIQLPPNYSYDPPALHSSPPSSHPPTAYPSPPRAPSPQPHSATTATKKKHVCPSCERAFTTSGHLARHARVHTGERNHKCPFPGCETRCSRQDNLQQHYRIHLSPGSRRSSASATRAAMTRAMGDPSTTKAANLSSLRKRTKSASTSPRGQTPAALPSPPLHPPPLEPAHYSVAGSMPILDAPDTPPPLAEARLSYPPPPESVCSRSEGSSPDLVHSNSSSHLHSLGHSPDGSYNAYRGHASALNREHSLQSNWSYRSQSGCTYQTEQGAGFSYAHPSQAPSPASSPENQQTHELENAYPFSGHIHQMQHSPPTNHHSGTGGAGAGSHTQYITHHQQLQMAGDHPHSRHSISHISHPQSLPLPSPTTTHSSPETSPPLSAGPLPVYRTSHEARYGMSESPQGQHPALPSASMHAGYESNSLSSAGYTHYTAPALMQQHSQYAMPYSSSPPPILAPIQSDRAMRVSGSDSQGHPSQQSHQSSGDHLQGADAPQDADYGSVHHPLPQHSNTGHYFQSYSVEGGGEQYHHAQWRMSDGLRARADLAQ